MNTTKKLMTLLLAMLALTACQDEPDKSSVEKITINGVSFNGITSCIGVAMCLIPSTGGKLPLGFAGNPKVPPRELVQLINEFQAIVPGDVLYGALEIITKFSVPSERNFSG